MKYALMIACVIVGGALSACGGGGGGAATNTSSTPASVEITTSAVLLTETGQAKVLAARVLDSSGREIPATVNWESTQPGQISVNGAGQVVALGEGGSAQITARVGELRSAPLMVFHSRVPVGTLLLTDAQIVGEPEETSPGAAPSITNTYRVRLSGVAAPVVGQLLLNTESKIVVGRVQAVQTDANGVHTVTLRLPALREILPTLRINETIDLRNAPVAIPDSVLAAYDVVREGSRFIFTPKSNTAQAARGRALQGASGTIPRAHAAYKGGVALPPFTSCEVTLEGAGGAGSLPIQLAKVPSYSLEFKPALDIVHTPEGGLERLVLTSQPTITTDLSLEFTAGFDGKLTCGIDLVVVRIPTPGPLAAFLGGLITLGAGAELSGKVVLPGVKVTNVSQRSTTLDLGIACPNGGSCSLVNELGATTVTNKAEITGPDLNAVRLEPSLFGYGKAQASIGNPFFTSLRFNAFYAKMGVALKTSLASSEGQIADANYKSSYGLSAVLKAGLDTDFQGLAAWLGLNGVAENLVELEGSLAASPTGTVSLAQSTFKAGDRVLATVNLDPASVRFLGLYNIADVILMRKVGAQPAQVVDRGTIVRDGTEMIMSFFAASDGTAGELYAFVTTYGVPFALLELGQASAVVPPAGDRISVGGNHTCALTLAGGVKCWGNNDYGQLGNGTTTNSSVPVDVTGLGAGVVAISAGFSHACAVTSAGAVKCWGSNTYGLLGNDTITDSSVPVDVAGLGTGVVHISVGRFHACAVTSAGAAKCWGSNSHGRLGNGTTTNSSVPVDVIGLGAGVVDISVGGNHTCALTPAGGVKCWGYNGNEQLGNGTITDSSVPVDVIGLGAGVVAISAGGYYSCAVTSAGAVKCWGYNNHGQLGNGTTTDSSVPVDVTGLGTGVVDFSAGNDNSCAVTSAGATKCWGYNGHGQLGNGTTTDSNVPVDVTGLGTGVVAISAGDYHSCAVTSAGAVKCWGFNVSGQLGNGTIAFGSNVPVSVVGFP